MNVTDGLMRGYSGGDLESSSRYPKTGAKESENYFSNNFQLSSGSSTFKSLWPKKLELNRNIKRQQVLLLRESPVSISSLGAFPPLETCSNPEKDQLIAESEILHKQKLESEASAMDCAQELIEPQTLEFVVAQESPESVTTQSLSPSALDKSNSSLKNQLISKLGADFFENFSVEDQHLINLSLSEKPEDNQELGDILSDLWLQGTDRFSTKALYCAQQCIERLNKRGFSLQISVVVGRRQGSKGRDLYRDMNKEANVLVRELSEILYERKSESGTMTPKRDIRECARVQIESEHLASNIAQQSPKSITTQSLSPPPLDKSNSSLKDQLISKLDADFFEKFSVEDQHLINLSLSEKPEDNQELGDILSDLRLQGKDRFSTKALYCSQQCIERLNKRGFSLQISVVLGRRQGSKGTDWYIDMNKEANVLGRKFSEILDKRKSESETMTPNASVMHGNMSKKQMS